MKLLSLIPCLALLGAATVHANTIQYDTTAGSVFNCINSGSLTGCGTSQIQIGGVMALTYLPTLSSVSVDPVTFPTTFTSFGNLQFTCLDGTKTCGAQTLSAGVTLTININQSLPDFLTGSIGAGVLVGTISGGSSNASVQWTPGASVELFGTAYNVIYGIQSPTLSLPPPASCFSGNCGMTSIQGQITELSTVPEPAVSLLCAGGLLAMGGFRRRKKS